MHKTSAKFFMPGPVRLFFFDLQIVFHIVNALLKSGAERVHMVESPDRRALSTPTKLELAFLGAHPFPLAPAVVEAGRCSFIRL